MRPRLTRLRQEAMFAVRVPRRQIARRLALVVRRRLERMLRPSNRVRGLVVAPALPGPVLPPRAGTMRHDAKGWHFSALGGSAEFGSRIDWQHPGPPGRDQLWRMTLHYTEWLEALPADLQMQAIDAWIEDTPPFTPHASSAGWNAYALSLRVVVWMQQAALAGGAWSDGFRGRMEASVAEQLTYLGRHLETDIGGNHLLKNIKALLWGAAFFSGPEAARWRRTAERLLGRELAQQILADGVHFELSPAYHCQVFADLLEIAAVLPDPHLKARLQAVLAKIAQAAIDLAHPDGRIAQFGDAGLSMAYAPATCVAAYASMAGDCAPLARPAFSFSDAGYFGVRAGGDYAVYDAGPIAPDRLPAHGHGDMFSFEWSLAGERVVVDQGVFQYTESLQRAQSRGAAHHNTLCIAGLDQAEFFGAFRSAWRARLLHREVSHTDAGLEIMASHDGFARNGGPVHTRKALLSPRRIVLEDQLDRPARRPARVTALLHPAITVERLGDGGLLLKGHRAHATARATLPLQVEEAVWWPDIGHEHTTRRIVVVVPPGTTAATLTLAALDP